VRGYMLRRHLSEPIDPEFLAPPAWPSVSWWTTPILNSMRRVIEARNRQGLRRGLVVLSTFAGIVAEAWSGAALGLPMSDFTAVEIDETACEFALKFHKSRITHMYGPVSCLKPTTMVGDCAVHGRYCVQRSLPSIDLFTGGPPCPPYSVFRHTRGSVPPEDHRDFYTTFGDPVSGEGGYLDIVKNYRPRGGESLENSRARVYAWTVCETR
jgi:hypothetical protein